MELERDPENAHKVSILREEIEADLRREIELIYESDPESLKRRVTARNLVDRAKDALGRRGETLGLGLIPLDFELLETAIILIIQLFSSPESRNNLRAEVIDGIEEAAAQRGIDAQEILRIMWQGKPRQDEE